jgi:hypothetical protein
MDDEHDRMDALPGVGLDRTLLRSAEGTNEDMPRQFESFHWGCWLKS